jgi:hypothetical protein
MTDEDDAGPVPEQTPQDPSLVEAPPLTGDPAVDEALGRLHESAAEGDLEAQSVAGEAVHRALQDRLTDLGG